MSKFKNVNDDILKDWLNFREKEYFSTLTNKDDRDHHLYFEEISDKILDSIPERNRDFVQKQLAKLDDNVMDYIGYWNEKYFRFGFCDDIELISGCLDRIKAQGVLYFLGLYFLVYLQYILKLLYAIFIHHPFLRPHLVLYNRLLLMFYNIVLNNKVHHLHYMPHPYMLQSYGHFLVLLFLHNVYIVFYLI